MNEKKRNRELRQYTGWDSQWKGVGSTCTIMYCMWLNNTSYRRWRYNWTLCPIAIVGNFWGKNLHDLQPPMKCCLPTDLQKLSSHVPWFCSGCVLTTLLLMQALDAHAYADQITSKFKQLCSIDPYRNGYYSDLCKYQQFTTIILLLLCKALYRVHHLFVLILLYSEQVHYWTDIKKSPPRYFKMW